MVSQLWSPSRGQRHPAPDTQRVSAFRDKGFPMFRYRSAYTHSVCVELPESPPGWLAMPVAVCMFPSTLFRSVRPCHPTHRYAAVENVTYDIDVGFATGRDNACWQANEAEHTTILAPPHLLNGAAVQLTGFRWPYNGQPLVTGRTAQSPWRDGVIGCESAGWRGKRGFTSCGLVWSRTHVQAPRGCFCKVAIAWSCLENGNHGEPRVFLPCITCVLKS